MSYGWNKALDRFDAPEDRAGDPDAWSAAANMLFASGCEAQSFVLLASFAAPLMALFDDEDGGAIVSIHGGRKSGKTVALTAAATVWGMPQALDVSGVSMKQRFRSLAHLRHLPAIDKTLGKGDPIVTATFIRGFAMPGAAWQTMILRACGESLVENVIASAAELPGVEFSVNVPRGLIAPKDGEHIEGRLLSNRGHAGPRFLSLLCQPDVLQWVRRKLASKFAEMRDTTGLGDERKAAMRAIAAVYVAGLLISDDGILELDPARISQWAADRVFPARDA